MKDLITLDDPEISLDATLVAAQQVAQRLSHLAYTMGPTYDQIQFYTRIREKSKSSISEKTTRKRGKRRGGIPYSFRDMTDLVGFRVVTLYDYQLIDAQAFVLSMIESGQELPEPLFIGKNAFGALREAKYYAQKNGDEYFQCHAALKKRLEESHDVIFAQPTNGSIERERIEIGLADENLYSSAHLIFDAISHQNGYRLRIPVEFQLRPAAEDIWAEVNHKQLYKIRDHFIWSGRFEGSYTEASEISRALKNGARELSDSMKKFSDESRAAKESLEEFSTHSAAGVADCSFCASLILRASGNELDAEINTAVNAYQESVRQLSECPETNGVDSLRCYNQCKTSLAKLRTTVHKVRQDKMKLIKGSPDSFRKKGESRRVLVLEQIEEILKLEQVRMRASAVGEEIILNKKSGRFSNPRKLLNTLPPKVLDEKVEVPGVSTRASDEKEILVAECMSIYADLCGFADSRKLKIRPLAVIHFWKHLLASRFNLEIAGENAIKSYGYLRHDRTVHENSIYRVEIPSVLASHYYYEVLNVVRKFSGKQSPIHTPINIGESIPSLRNSLASKLAEAVKLAVESEEESQKGNIGRGDFRLGALRDESRRNLRLISDCRKISRNFLGIDIPRPESALALRVERLEATA